MQKRPIGTSELQVAPLVFGGNVFGWTADERTSFSILDAFVDHGLNFIDTADVYSAWIDGHKGGESETIIGKWFKESGKRDKIVLATKVGMLSTRAGLSAANIAAAVDDSLRRLKTDYIDVYFSHLDDDKTPFEETLGAYQKLDQGGQGAGDRRVELQRRTARSGAESIRRHGPAGVSDPPARVQPVRSRRLRDGSRTGCAGAQDRRRDVFQPRERLPERQISLEGRTRATPRADRAWRNI